MIVKKDPGSSHTDWSIFIRKKVSNIQSWKFCKSTFICMKWQKKPKQSKRASGWKQASKVHWRETIILVRMPHSTQAANREVGNSKALENFMARVTEENAAGLKKACDWELKAYPRTVMVSLWLGCQRWHANNFHSTTVLTNCSQKHIPFSREIFGGWKAAREWGVSWTGCRGLSTEREHCMKVSLSGRSAARVDIEA